MRPFKNEPMQAIYRCGNRLLSESVLKVDNTFRNVERCGDKHGRRSETKSRLVFTLEVIADSRPYRTRMSRTPGVPISRATTLAGRQLKLCTKGQGSREQVKANVEVFIFDEVDTSSLTQTRTRSQKKILAAKSCALAWWQTGRSEFARVA